MTMTMMTMMQQQLLLSVAIVPLDFHLMTTMMIMMT
jgi:hypothetical protein